MTPPDSFLPQDLRIDYSKGELTESSASADPMEQFARWFADAKAAKVPEPNAMTLSTAGVDGAPSARIVLLKGFDQDGFTFFTNYGSRKGQELRDNPRAALTIYWQPLERQVRIEGTAEKVSRGQSEAYFHTRPRGARLSAWASSQSQPIASREALQQRLVELERAYENQPIPLPPHWGGYTVRPSTIEFWQGRPDRLHDRLRYRRVTRQWLRERLSP